MTTTTDAIQGIIDEHEITRTIYQWAHALDAGDLDAFIDTYTEGGSMEVFVKGSPLSGREQFKGFVDMNVSQGVHLHLVCSPRIQLDGDEATADSYIVRLDGYGEDLEPIIRAFAVYRDEFVRCDDGRWRLRYRFVDRKSFNRLGVDPNHPAAIRPSAATAP